MFINACPIPFIKMIFVLDEHNADDANVANDNEDDTMIMLAR